MPAKPIPDGFGTLTPHITVKGAKKAIEFYKKAFGAEELVNHAMPDGTVMHASLRIGDSMLMLNDEFPQMGAKGPQSLGGTPVTLHLFVQDVDKAFDRAVLKADEPARARLAAEWPAVVADAVSSGAAEFDERGRLRIVVP